MSSTPNQTIVFAAGGTGGHLFPAQALAEQILQKTSHFQIFFAGADLQANPYFDKEKFVGCNITSSTPFRGNPFKAIKILFAGVQESIRFLEEKKPSLVVGFGSFHSFPILCAAVLKKIPLVLFESNAIPGKVVRFFSRKAEWTGIHFAETERYLKGKTIDVHIPSTTLLEDSLLSKEEARRQFGLKPDLFTLLVFGGSQGAQEINKLIDGMLPLLEKEKFPLQLIHFTGNEPMAQEIRLLCRHLQVPCYVKKFEKQMDIAWRACDLAICRSGAMTLSELLRYKVPAILIPYPRAADGHQLKNALFFEKEVKGGITMQEETATAEKLFISLLPLVNPDSPQIVSWKKGIETFKAGQKKADLASLVIEFLEKR